ncbi:hypothetical protein M0812_26426 [Anaeramoeba flamelloides]|uniref:Calponin-homology (CH) domain-containing protein n=1 Tax=Anaeramoeba flamelloides TaxID=1746091 RepID=A0AAV7YAK1_9EUKA|nr:hypothetical protein M0812_26426 [Anaeramoeba flamelloides]
MSSFISKWLTKVLGKKIQETILQDPQKLSISLCVSLNIIQPKLINPIHNDKTKLNFDSFLDGCKKLGISKRKLFDPQSLLQTKDYKQLAEVLNLIKPMSVLTEEEEEEEEEEKEKEQKKIEKKQKEKQKKKKKQKQKQKQKLKEKQKNHNPKTFLVLRDIQNYFEQYFEKNKINKEETTQQFQQEFALGTSIFQTQYFEKEKEQSQPCTIKLTFDEIHIILIDSKELKYKYENKCQILLSKANPCSLKLVFNKKQEVSLSFKSKYERFKFCICFSLFQNYPQRIPQNSKISGQVFGKENEIRSLALRYVSLNKAKFEVNSKQNSSMSNNQLSKISLTRESIKLMIGNQIQLQFKKKILFRNEGLLVLNEINENDPKKKGKITKYLKINYSTILNSQEYELKFAKGVKHELFVKTFKFFETSFKKSLHDNPIQNQKRYNNNNSSISFYQFLKNDQNLNFLLRPVLQFNLNHSFLLKEKQIDDYKEKLISKLKKIKNNGEINFQLELLSSTTLKSEKNDLVKKKINLFFNSKQLKIIDVEKNELIIKMKYQFNSNFLFNLFLNSKNEKLMLLQIYNQNFEKNTNKNKNNNSNQNSKNNNIYSSFILRTKSIKQRDLIYNIFNIFQKKTNVKKKLILTGSAKNLNSSYNLNNICKFLKISNNSDDYNNLLKSNLRSYLNENNNDDDDDDNHNDNKDNENDDDDDLQNDQINKYKVLLFDSFGTVSTTIIIRLLLKSFQIKFPNYIYQTKYNFFTFLAKFNKNNDLLKFNLDEKFSIVIGFNDIKEYKQFFIDFNSKVKNCIKPINIKKNNIFTKYFSYNCIINNKENAKINLYSNRFVIKTNDDIYQNEYFHQIIHHLNPKQNDEVNNQEPNGNGKKEEVYNCGNEVKIAIWSDKYLKLKFNSKKECKDFSKNFEKIRILYLSIKKKFQKKSFFDQFNINLFDLVDNNKLISKKGELILSPNGIFLKFFLGNKLKLYGSYFPLNNHLKIKKINGNEDNKIELFLTKDQKFIISFLNIQNQKSFEKKIGYYHKLNNYSKKIFNTSLKSSNFFQIAFENKIDQQLINTTNDKGDINKDGINDNNDNNDNDNDDDDDEIKMPNYSELFKKVDNKKIFHLRIRKQGSKKPIKCILFFRLDEIIFLTLNGILHKGKFDEISVFLNQKKLKFIKFLLNEKNIILFSVFPNPKSSQSFHKLFRQKLEEKQNGDKNDNIQSGGGSDSESDGARGSVSGKNSKSVIGGSGGSDNKIKAKKKNKNKSDQNKIKKKKNDDRSNTKIKDGRKDIKKNKNKAKSRTNENETKKNENEKKAFQQNKYEKRMKKARKNKKNKILIENNKKKSIHTKNNNKMPITNNKKKINPSSVSQNINSNQKKKFHKHKSLKKNKSRSVSQELIGLKTKKKKRDSSSITSSLTSSVIETSVGGIDFDVKFLNPNNGLVTGEGFIRFIDSPNKKIHVINRNSKKMFQIDNDFQIFCHPKIQTVIKINYKKKIIGLDVLQITSKENFLIELRKYKHYFNSRNKLLNENGSGDRDGNGKNTNNLVDIKNYKPKFSDNIIFYEIDFLNKKFDLLESGVIKFNITQNILQFEKLNEIFFRSIQKNSKITVHKKNNEKVLKIRFVQNNEQSKNKGKDNDFEDNDNNNMLLKIENKDERDHFYNIFNEIKSIQNNSIQIFVYDIRRKRKKRAILSLTINGFQIQTSINQMKIFYYHDLLLGISKKKKNFLKFTYNNQTHFIITKGLLTRDFLIKIWKQKNKNKNSRLIDDFSYNIANLNDSSYSSSSSSSSSSTSSSISSSFSKNSFSSSSFSSSSFSSNSTSSSIFFSNGNEQKIKANIFFVKILTSSEKKIKNAIQAKIMCKKHSFLISYNNNKLKEWKYNEIEIYAHHKNEKIVKIIKKKRYFTFQFLKNNIRTYFLDLVSILIQN